MRRTASNNCFGSQLIMPSTCLLTGEMYEDLGLAAAISTTLLAQPRLVFNELSHPTTCISIALYLFVLFVEKYDFFAAYPSNPPHVAHSIEAAEKANSSHIQFVTWRSTFGPGRMIDQSVLTEIENADGLLCDITFPNENVFFEIGYAVGLL